MYSGTGTAIFDWIKYAQGYFNFSVIMDTENKKNYELTRNFCNQYSLHFFPSRPFKLPGCIDSGLRDLESLLITHYFDFIECVSWANAATNLSVLSSRNRSKLVFTPHTQPLWTIPNPEQYWMIPSVLQKIVKEADFIFADSELEMKSETLALAKPNACHHIPLGVADEFKYSSYFKPKNQIVCICDCREKRKRIDLLLQSFKEILKHKPSAKLILGGRGSDTLYVPPEISNQVQLLGYIDQHSLIRLYQQSDLFMLLSDYEAFGLPIAEALACGCPVLVNNLEILQSIFGNLPGTCFVENTDSARIAKLALGILSSPDCRSEISNEAHNAFSFESTYGKKLDILLHESS